MIEEYSSLVSEPAQVTGPRRRTRRMQGERRPSARRGRMLLIVIFFTLAGVNAMVYLGMPRELDKAALLASIAVSMMWYTALLAGIWRRRNWCRHALIILLFATVAGIMFIVPSSLQILDNPIALSVFVADMAIRGIVAWLLAESADIRRLTSRAQD